MKTVNGTTHCAAFRFGLIAAKGGSKGLQPRVPLADAPTIADISEFITRDGEVLSRRVRTSKGEEFWLRADIAAEAAAKLLAEAAEYNRIAEQVCRASLDRDIEAAKRAQMTVENYRLQRNHRLARIDQRRGRNSVGLG